MASRRNGRMYNVGSVQRRRDLTPGNLAHITYAALLFGVNISPMDISTSAKKTYVFKEREFFVRINSDVFVRMCMVIFLSN